MADQTSGDTTVANRERRLAERFLEDEALRGDLDDATWQPVQDWLLRACGRVAAATASQDDRTAHLVLEKSGRRLRDIGRTLAGALAAPQMAPSLEEALAPLVVLLGPPLVTPKQAKGAAMRIQKAARIAAATHLSPSETASRVVAALEDAGQPT